MKIQFDPKQEYQRKAVNAVMELFDGQPLDVKFSDVGLLRDLPDDENSDGCPRPFNSFRRRPRSYAVHNLNLRAQ